jgi:hypothetical protein
MFAIAYPQAATAVRCAVGLVFLTAALGKLRSWTIFQGVVANYRLLPQALILPVTYALPPAEALIGGAMLARVGSPWTEGAAAALLLTFALAMAINLARGRSYIDCGCFHGTLKQTLRWSLVARNGLMTLLTALIATSHGATDAWTELNGLLAGIALFVVVQCLNVLWATGRGGHAGVASSAVARGDSSRRDDSGAGAPDRRAA